MKKNIITCFVVLLLANCANLDLEKLKIKHELMKMESQFDFPLEGYIDMDALKAKFAKERGINFIIGSNLLNKVEGQSNLNYMQIGCYWNNLLNATTYYEKKNNVKLNNTLAIKEYSSRLNDYCSLRYKDEYDHR